jgi:ribose transport system ATP-binding protein
MTVAENIALVRGYPRRGKLVSWSQVRNRASEVLGTIGLDISPEADVSELTMAQRSLVAISRALSAQARFVVLDEPTAALPASDVDRLVTAIERMRAEGIGFLYVTHRIDEVFRIADTVTVLRDGRVVLSAPVAGVSRADLVEAIVGQEVSGPAVIGAGAAGAAVLELRDVSAAGVAPVSLTVAAGEIVGLVGLSGAGQTEIGRVVAGVMPTAGGTMSLDGNRYAPRSPADALAQGIGFVAGNRLEESLATELTVQENLYINPVVDGGRVLRPRSRRTERRQATGALGRFAVRPREPSIPVGLLSGGNQQKVVVARWLEAGLTRLVLEEPTAGVDIAAKAQIHDLFRRLASRGGAMLVVSSDFEEVADICDRVLIFSRGRMVQELAGADIQVGTLTRLAAGAADGTTTGAERI